MKEERVLWLRLEHCLLKGRRTVRRAMEHLYDLVSGIVCLEEEERLDDSRSSTWWWPPFESHLFGGRRAVEQSAEQHVVVACL